MIPFLPKKRQRTGAWPSQVEVLTVKVLECYTYVSIYIHIYVSFSEANNPQLKYGWIIIDHAYICSKRLGIWFGHIGMVKMVKGWSNQYIGGTSLPARTQRTHPRSLPQRVQLLAVLLLVCVRRSEKGIERSCIHVMPMISHWGGAVWVHEMHQLQGTLYPLQPKVC